MRREYTYKDDHTTINLATDKNQNPFHIYILTFSINDRC